MLVHFEFPAGLQIVTAASGKTLKVQKGIYLVNQQEERKEYGGDFRAEQAIFIRFITFSFVFSDALFRKVGVGRNASGQNPRRKLSGIPPPDRKNIACPACMSKQ